MTVKELVLGVTKRVGGSNKLSHKYVDAIVDTLKEALLSDGQAKLYGFCTFNTAIKPEHQGYNPATGQVITVGERKVLRARFSPSFKKELNKEYLDKQEQI